MVNSALHYEIWKYYQSTSKAHASVLQNLVVLRYARDFCGIVGIVGTQSREQGIHQGWQELGMHVGPQISFVPLPYPGTGLQHGMIQHLSTWQWCWHGLPAPRAYPRWVSPQP